MNANPTYLKDEKLTFFTSPPPPPHIFNKKIHKKKTSTSNNKKQVNQHYNDVDINIKILIRSHL